MAAAQIKNKKLKANNKLKKIKSLIINYENTMKGLILLKEQY